ILSPNAVIIDGPGFTGPDGKSIMPSYADSLSVVQLVDLVAFLKSLTSGGGHPHGAAAAVKSEGDYTVRLEYRVGDQGLGDQARHHAGDGFGARPLREAGDRRLRALAGLRALAHRRLRRGQRRLVVRLGADLLHVLDVLHSAVLANHEDRARGEAGDRSVLDLDPVGGTEGALAEVGDRLDARDPGGAAPT